MSSWRWLGWVWAKTPIRSPYWFADFLVLAGTCLKIYENRFGRQIGTFWVKCPKGIRRPDKSAPSLLARQVDADRDTMSGASWIRCYSSRCFALLVALMSVRCYDCQSIIPFEILNLNKLCKARKKYSIDTSIDASQ